MISYDPFWKTLLARDLSTYHLVYKEGISANTIQRMRHGKAITTNTLNELCDILNCSVAEIIEYRTDPKEETPAKGRPSAKP